MKSYLERNLFSLLKRGGRILNEKEVKIENFPFSIYYAGKRVAGTSLWLLAVCVIEEFIEESLWCENQSVINKNFGLFTLNFTFLLWLASACGRSAFSPFLLSQTSSLWLLSIFSPFLNQRLLISTRSALLPVCRCSRLRSIIHSQPACVLSKANVSMKYRSFLELLRKFSSIVLLRRMERNWCLC